MSLPESIVKDEKIEPLTTPEFWNERYSHHDNEENNDKPSHEWFRTFTALKPFFEKNLFSISDDRDRRCMKILHLGSGDSVSFSSFSLYHLCLLPLSCLSLVWSLFVHVFLNHHVCDSLLLYV